MRTCQKPKGAHMNKQYSPFLLLFLVAVMVSSVISFVYRNINAPPEYQSDLAPIQNEAVYGGSLHGAPEANMLNKHQRILMKGLRFARKGDGGPCFVISKARPTTGTEPRFELITCTKVPPGIVVPVF